MHLQDTILTSDLGVKVIRNVAQYCLHHVTYAPAKFKVATFNVDFPKSVHFFLLSFLLFFHNSFF